MINLLPAVLIAGHSQVDKSMLFYNLSHVLHERHIAHHALRVSSLDEDTHLPAHRQANIRLLSVHDACDGAFIDRLSKDLSQRLLPMLIDADISTDHEYLQSRILQQCTHLLLLLSADHPADKVSWLQLGERYGLLPLISMVSSSSQKRASGKTRTSVLAETPLNFVHSLPEQEPFFDCLVEQMADLFSTYSPADTMRMHLHRSPGELPLDVATLLHAIDPNLKSWHPPLLNALLEQIPRGASLAVYGQGPQWLYGTLAAHTSADEFYQFNPDPLPGEMSAGWVASPPLLLGTTTKSKIHVACTKGDESYQLTIEMTNPPLDYLQAVSLPFPPVHLPSGLILAGIMPTWLLTAVIRLYVHAGVAWIACDQGQQKAIVVFSRTSQHVVGEIISTL